MSPHSLLLIDDEPEVGAFVRRVAESCAFDVTVTQEARSFKQEFAVSNPDVVALDLAVPSGDGVELLRHLAETGCVAQVILISGFDRRVMDTAWRFGKALGLKMAAKIEKPVRAADLRAALADLLTAS